MKTEQTFFTPDEVVINKIYLLRHQKVMIDKDLAALYKVPTFRIREQVKRNIERFPEKFMFQLTEKEVEALINEKVIASRRHLGGTLPFAFTEHGVLMAANVLKSPDALAMSIRIIEIFVRLREMLLSHKELLLQVEKLEREVVTHTIDIKNIFIVLKELVSSSGAPAERIGYKKDIIRP